MSDNAHCDFSSLFPADQTPVYRHLAALVSYSNGRQYEFLDHEIFDKLVHRSPADGMEVYWRELLDRAHFAAAVSSIRHFRWINGCLAAVHQENYLMFCACFRGLLESTADSFEALFRLPFYFAQNHKMICRLLAREDFGKDVMVAPEVEKCLIHFSHARKKIGISRETPAEHRAKNVTEYLSILERGKLTDVMECYGELCEVAHPSVFSLAGFIDVSRSHENTVWCLNANADAVVIGDFRRRYAALISEILQYALNPLLLLLYVLDRYPIERYKCSPISNVDLGNIPEFRKVAALFG